MISPTRWTWVWANSGCWWWTGKPGMLQSMGSQRVRHDWVTELNWTDYQLVRTLTTSLGFCEVSLHGLCHISLLKPSRTVLQMCLIFALISSLCFFRLECLYSFCQLVLYALTFSAPVPTLLSEASLTLTIMSFLSLNILVLLIFCIVTWVVSMSACTLFLPKRFSASSRQ